MSELVSQYWRDDNGQDIAEYAMMLAVLLVIVLATLKNIGAQANKSFAGAANQLR